MVHDRKVSPSVCMNKTKIRTICNPDMPGRLNNPSIQVAGKRRRDFLPVLPVCYCMLKKEDMKSLGLQLTDIGHRHLVDREGIEPPTQGFSVLCSTN